MAQTHKLTVIHVEEKLLLGNNSLIPTSFKSPVKVLDTRLPPFLSLFVLSLKQMGFTSVLKVFCIEKLGLESLLDLLIGNS